MSEFSTQNISRPELLNITSLRLEGLIIRLRYVVYTLLIVSLTNFPLACCIFILLLEVFYLAAYTSYTFEYNYVKNWLLFVSKMNVGLAIIAMCLTGIHLNIIYTNALDFNNRVNSQLQKGVLGVLIVAIAVEVLVLVFALIMVAWRAI